MPSLSKLKPERDCAHSRRTNTVKKTIAKTDAKNVTEPVFSSYGPAVIELVNGSKGISIESLPDGPLLTIVGFLNVTDLKHVDCASQSFKKLTRTMGPWRALGNSEFQGMEIDNELFDDGTKSNSQSLYLISHYYGKNTFRMDWKERFLWWRREVPKFRSPFNGRDLFEVKNSDEVSYCRCKFRTDHITKKGVYLEVTVNQNADNLSLAVVDFDEGGKSSVTFSPDTGAVIKETKIQETPRKVKGWYIQPLRHIPPRAQTVMRNERFEGSMGLYIKDEKIAFFRRYSHSRNAEWESTGFIISLDWAKGRKLTPCLAFRDEGAYNVSIAKVCSEPPFEPRKYDDAWTTNNWQELNWEGGANN